MYLLLINPNLRVTLQQLELQLAIKLDSSAVEAVFEEDTVSAKFYTLFKYSRFLLPDWTIEGIVDEHEPETIFIQSRGGFSKQKAFDSFFRKLGPHGSASRRHFIPASKFENCRLNAYSI